MQQVLTRRRVLATPVRVVDRTEISFVDLVVAIVLTALAVGIFFLLSTLFPIKATSGATHEVPNFLTTSGDLTSGGSGQRGSVLK